MDARLYPCPEEEAIIMIPAIIIELAELERINGWKIAETALLSRTGRIGYGFLVSSFELKDVSYPTTRN